MRKFWEISQIEEFFEENSRIFVLGDKKRLQSSPKTLVRSLQKVHSDYASNECAETIKTLEPNVTMS